jgi:hypothetical protein
VTAPSSWTPFDVLVWHVNPASFPDVVAAVARQSAYTALRMTIERRIVSIGLVRCGYGIPADEPMSMVEIIRQTAAASKFDRT